MKLHKVAFCLLVIGGLNWLVVGLWGKDLIMGVLGLSWTVAQIIYILVGVSAIVEVVGHKKNCKACEMKGGETHKM